jgi:hypothetical protein
METIETIVGTTANTTCTVATTDTSSNTNTSTSNSSNNIIDIQVSPPACAVIIDQQEKNGMTLFTSDDHTNANCNDPLLIRKDQEQQEEEPSIEITVDGHHEQELSTATAAAIHNRSPTTNTSSSSVAVTHSSPMLQCSKSSINKHHPTLLPSSSFSNTLNQSSPVVAKDKQSLNSSVVTEKTAELSSSSFLDASCDGLNLSLESNGTTTVIDKSTTTTTSHNNNNKGGVSLILPNELFADALEQLTDLAMATGIVSNPSSSSTDIPHGRDTHSSPHKIDNPSRGGKRVHAAKWVMEGEEPGRIYSAANSSSGAGEGKEHDNDDEEEEEEGDDDECEGDDCRPYDEEPVWKPPIQGPFRSEEELSAIVRMRYYKAMGKKTLLGGEDGSDYNNNNKKKDVGVKSYQESQRETIERWKSLKAEVSQQEVDRMKLSPSGGKNHSSSRKTVSKRKKNKKKKQKYESSTTTSGSYSEEGDGSSLDGVGLFDFSFLTRSLEEAWNQSQATLLEAMVGDKKKMGGSEEEEDSYASSTSSSSYEYEEEEEEGSCSPSDSSKEYKMKKERRGRRKGGKALKARNYHDDDNDDDEMESVEEEEEEDGYDDDNHVGRNGSVSNRNFLEVSVPIGIRMKINFLDVVLHLTLTDFV